MIVVTSEQRFDSRNVQIGDTLESKFQIWMNVLWPHYLFALIYVYNGTEIRIMRIEEKKAKLRKEGAR